MVRSIHPSNYQHPPIYLSIDLSIQQSIYLPIHLSIYLSIILSLVETSIYLSIYRSIHLSLYLSIHLSIYLSITILSLVETSLTHSPSSLHVSTILFCSTGTSHGFISTPRSPLATMIPSDRSTIYRIVVWVLYQVTWRNTSYRTYATVQFFML